MKQSLEKIIKIGFRRSPKKICDEIESVSAAMVREGWVLVDTVLEDSLGALHLFFEREINVCDREIVL